MAASLIKFGLYELNTGARKLYKQGRRVRLQEQPLRILEILLERPGELVTREELRNRIWPGDVHVDFDLGLNGAIKRLRVALDDSADNPIFIETVPKRGYRFLSPVHRVEAPTDPSAQFTTLDPQSVARERPTNDNRSGYASPGGPAATMGVRHFSRGTLVGAAIFLVAILFIAINFLRPLTPPLRVLRIVKLSNDGHAWSQGNLFSDGPRLYYSDYKFGAGYQMRQVLLNGNENTAMPGISPDALIENISPDGTSFLGTFRSETKEDHSPGLWIEPVIGGPARRIGDIAADDAAWSSDGNLLAFGNGGDLRIAARDGTGVHTVAKAPGTIVHPRWSPDDKRIRFTLYAPQSVMTIWEVGADGSDLHRLDFHWPGAPAEGYGEWTPDGHFYIFASRQEEIFNLWAIEEQTDWLHRARHEPVQLTAGPISYSRPLPSRDGAKIFALGTVTSGELQKYDQSRKEFVQFAAGLPADHADFTRDGAWMAYVTYPEGTLWRARTDGTEPLQLTFPPHRVTNPRWSPDGKRILFVMREPGELPKICTISFDGGNAEPVVSEAHAQTSATWSPDGNSIFFGRDPYGENQDMSIYRVDLRSKRAEKIPGADDLFAPILSPDGRYLAVQSTAGDHLLTLIDLPSGKRMPITKSKVDYPAWSADSQFLYCNTFTSDNPMIIRVHVPDGKVEKVVDLPFKITGVYGFWSGLTPDGSVLLFRSHEQTDVYALGLR
jgi:DNA-binding winged helix-turn-helix (wHTH) protein/Tol biopolymer transport system component